MIPQPNYVTTPAQGIAVLLEHAQKFFDNVKAMNAARTDSVGADKIVKTNDINSAIDYVRTLMAQNIKA
ncbi:hypothetical protein [Brevibacillus sp. SYSU BS000544]|uniref:hypothetical protein n=1 Tax=Brevibacillus sp. SYSU BS000544 TaxID=3416443 RepID=UPI003CE5AAA1